MNLECTEVFDWNWEAIHVKAYIVNHVKGDVWAFYKEDEKGKLQYIKEAFVDVSKYVIDKKNNATYLIDINNLKEFGESLLVRRFRYVINEGSSRSSKTYSLIDCLDLYARKHTNKRQTIWRDTKTDCKKTVLNDFLKRLKSTGRYSIGQQFNKTESIFHYSTNSTVEIHGTDDEETVHGLTQDVAWINEPYKISRATFDQIDQRTSDFVLLDWNPKKAHFIDDLKKDPRTIVIKSTFKNNPFCPAEQRSKILSYQPVTLCSLVVDKLLMAQEARDYNIQENALNLTNDQLSELSRCIENEYKKTASEFNWQVYGLGEKAEKPHRIFHWEEIDVNEYNKLALAKYIGVDWGTVDPFAVIEAKYDDGCLYLHELNYESENEIRSRLNPLELYNIQKVDEGLVTWLFKKLCIPYNTPMICDRNRTAKITALRANGWDYAVAASKLPGSIIDGIDLLNNLKVYYTSTSLNLKYEQENYSRKVDKYGIIQEEAEDLDNHLMDCARYVAIFLQEEGIITKI